MQKQVTDDSFESDVIKADMPVLVDFWAGVVRAVQADRAGARGAGNRVERQGHGRQDQHRRKPRRPRPNTGCAAFRPSCSSRTARWRRPRSARCRRESCSSGWNRSSDAPIRALTSKARRDGGPFFGVPSMIDSLEVQVLYPARWRRRISEAQGRRREAGSEGSVEQSRDPMDKNRIRGLPGRTSGPMIAKSIAIKGRGGKSGGCAVKAVGLTSGGLRRVRKPRTERFRKGRDRGAEVSRRHSSRLAGEGLNDGQGQ